MNHKVTTKFRHNTFSPHCDTNVLIMWLSKKIYESHLHHNFITMLKVMKMWWKCDELPLVLIFWLISFENSRHGKKVDDHLRWRKEMTVCSALLSLIINFFAWQEFSNEVSQKNSTNYCPSHFHHFFMKMWWNKRK